MGPAGVGVPVTQVVASSHGDATVTLDQALTQANTFRSYVTILADPASKDENKLKAAQLLNEDLETIVLSPHYLSFLDHAVHIFLKVLNEGDPLFISEYQIQQLRKLILEMIHRLPSNDQLKKYHGPILSVLFKLLDIDNEENVMVALQIISEFHKTYRPTFTHETQKFLQLMKNMYKELPNHFNSIFESEAQIRVKDLTEVNIEALLRETYTITPIITEKKHTDGSTITYNLIPRAILSIKVLTELPIIFVLLLQLYKEQIYGDVEEFIPLIMDAIILQPLQSQRKEDSFYREIFVSVIGVQIKILSFLAYNIKTYQVKVGQYTSKLGAGMLNLLRLCPDEVASLRKELLIATKHIFSLNLRNWFAPHIDKLLDESLLFGKGWTVHETLRPLAYTTLADLIHHVRQHLDLGILIRAINLFSKVIHDETISTSIQTMSCKLLLNLVESIKNLTGQNSNEISLGQDLLMKMLNVFVNKFKFIAKVQLPYLRNKEQNSNSNINLGSASDIKQEDQSCVSVAESDKVDPTSKYIMSSASAHKFSIVDCKAIIKVLVSGVKNIAWGCVMCGPLEENELIKPFKPKETLVFIRFVKWAMQSFEIYSIITPGIQPQVTQRGQVSQAVRSKEEKEVLENFASIFNIMSSRTFKEIFTTNINYVVERIYKNPALQVVANSFLAKPETSPIFATILVEYLLNHMEEMGSQSDRATLYLKLFKLIFGSVSILAAENEQMLQPYLHQIVNRSMGLAMTAKDPYNYFLLLRALFRSIGGGNHDTLYHEFLPLLPTLLQGLNSLQSGLHKQHMKDLFVELCLTVPVRLSSLLPYLPMLMDPLLSALNGSQTLISQGLRTLELCVDNLPPDFLHEHIQPVRAELMQVLWKILRNPNEQIAQVAFRVLGKFGGGNRKMITKPQYLDYTDQEVSTSCMTIHFPDHKAPIMLPIDKIIDAALIALRASDTESWHRQKGWEVIRGFLIGSIEIDEDKFNVSKLFTHSSFIESDIPNLNGQYYKYPDEKARKVQQTALTAMFVAATVKDLGNEVFQIMVSLVRHYTMVAVVQQAFPFSLKDRWNKAQGMDPLVLIDSIAMIMGHEEEELCKPGQLALILIINTAADILGSKERASQLPIMEYIVEKMCNLCYNRAWYAKLGGCLAISTLSDHMALKWVLDHQYIFLKAFFYVMMDLTDEVSTGAIEKAKSNLESLLIICTSPLKGENDTEELRATKRKSLHNVTCELVRQITSSNTIVREQAIESIKTVAKLTQKSIAEVVMPHNEAIAGMTLPKKHLILRHQPDIIQIGLMDGNTFFASINPRMLTLDLGIPDHKSYFKDLLQLVEKNDDDLLKLSCYKNLSNLIPLRKSALRALSACCYISNIRETVFSTIYKFLNNSVKPELQETAFECLEKYLKNCTLRREIIYNLAGPLLLEVCQLHSITLAVIQRLSYLIRLFPSIIHEKLCGYLSHHLTNLLDAAISDRKRNMTAFRQDNDDLKLCSNIVDIFHQIPSVSSKFIETLCKLVLHAEMELMMEAASPFRDPLMKYLLRYPSETIQHFLSDRYSVDQQYGRFLEYLVKHEKGEPFQQTLKSSGERLLTMIVSSTSPLPVQVGEVASAFQHGDKRQKQYLAIKLIYILIRSDKTWITTQTEILKALQSLWTSNELQVTHQSGEGVDFVHWNVPRLIVFVLLTYFKQNVNEVNLLFQLMQSFVGRYMPNFQFLREFLDQTVAQTYSVEWKRSTFFQFVEVFKDSSVSQELKAKILQHIIIPCFSVSLDRGEGDSLIGYPPDPDQDHADNIVSIFINKIIPEKPFEYNDAVRIMLLQLSCLLVEKASAHIHDAASKRQGVKLRRLMTFAWPCLVLKNCVDSITKYHGHLLLSHIIAKFAIHKRIVLQVFHSLLKAHAMEAREVVRQSLEILTPAMPVRMEDGNTMLIHWTRKILMEESHSVGQLVHILQLIIRHSSIYYPVRHQLTPQLIQAVNRLGFTPGVNIIQRCIAVDLAEVCIQWEERRVAEETEVNSVVSLESVPRTSPTKRNNSADGNDSKRVKLSSAAGTSSSQETKSDTSKPMEKSLTDLIVYFLLRLACQVNESTPTPGTNPPGEALSKRCVVLLKRALQPNIWPNSDPKLAWLDKLFVNLENSSPNLTNISVGLELLTYLIGTLKNYQILIAIKSVTKGLHVCMTHSNEKIIKLTYNLLAKLMSTFPLDIANPTGSNFEELDDLYAKISQTIYEGLHNCQKFDNKMVSTLYGTLMMLKAACQGNPFYLDRLISALVEVIQKMTRYHLNPPPAENISSLTELLIMSLDLVKNRIGVLGADLRISFIGQILVGLIEKTPEAKVMKAITKIIEEWVKNKSLIAVNQGPTLQEKSILLGKLMYVVEKRFPDDTELIGNYFEIVLFVYQDETLKQTELISKLEPAFLSGLRCTQPHIRAKFFQVYQESMTAKMCNRLLYIVCSQNWENFGSYYWIKQCIELLLVTAKNDVPITKIWVNNLLPSMSRMIRFWGDAVDKPNYSEFINVMEETSEEFPIDIQKEDMGVDLDTLITAQSQPLNQILAKQRLNNYIWLQNTFTKRAKELMSGDFLSAVAQLCYYDTTLSEWLWIKLFPRLWGILSERQQQNLGSKIQSFIASGIHNIQKDCHPSALGTFVEALSYCQPSISIPPNVMQHLCKGHNLWYRMTLMLEQAAQDTGAFSNPKNTRKGTDVCRDNVKCILPPEQEAINALSHIYNVLKEEDLWSGLWQTVSTYPETKMAITYEQHGFFEEAQAAYELAMTKENENIALRPTPFRLMSEINLWETHWIRCTKELNQWEVALEYGHPNKGSDPFLVLDSVWHVPNWPLMKDALSHIEQAYPKELAWKINLYRGYLALCHPEEQHLKLVEKLVEVASSFCLKEWKRLPTIVSHIHLTHLQAAQQMLELQEAVKIHDFLLQENANSFQNVRNIIETWRNRLPVIADDLSHWSDIFTWRQHLYHFIVNHYTELNEHQGKQILGVHASAQDIIHFGKVARKHNLSNICFDSLSKIHTIQSLPVVDCFQKIRQQVKCYHQMAFANNMGKTELQEGLEIIESTNLKFFTKEMIAELYALKGSFLTQLGRTEEANKALSASVQLHDTLVKGWAMWGDYLEGLFIRDPARINIGVSAITCFLRTARHENESKSRKHLAKIIWLLTFDDEAESLSIALDKYSVGVPAVQWLTWVPQITACIARPEGKVAITLLNQLGKVFPQAVYFSIRTLYLTLRIEQWGINRRDSSALSQAASQVATTQPSSSTGLAAAETTSAVGNQAPIRATEPMKRCSQILQTLRDCHPTVLVSLEGFAEQLSVDCFRENFYEELLRKLRLALGKCYTLAFENSNAVAESFITPHTHSFVEKLIASFDMKFEKIAAQLSASGCGYASAEMSTVRWIQQQKNIQYPAFQKLRTQFKQDFDLSHQESRKLHNFIHKLKKWIKILEIKTKDLSKWFILNDKCKFMSNFNLQIEQIELPGEYLLRKPSEYCIQIARFLPRVDIIQKHGTAPRRLYIRGHNGRIYPFLVISDSLNEGCREERVLQLMRMLNQFFVKQKETSRRLVNMNVMKVVALSPQMRLVEDNVSSLSLLDVYKFSCIKKFIEPNMPINKYYDKLAAIQAKGSHATHQILRDIVKEVQFSMVPKTILKDWAISTFPNPTHYWTFRKILTTQLSLVCLMEYSLHLTRLYPDMLHIHRDSGLINVSYFKFNIDCDKGELDGNWPVPFRLTPNLAELVTAIGVSGPFTAIMISAARCLCTPSFKVVALLRAILKDEIIAWHKKQDWNALVRGSSSSSGEKSFNNLDSKMVINLVNKAVVTITSRMQSLSTLDGTDDNNKVTQLVRSVNCVDNLCRMDPAWHPWL